MQASIVLKEVVKSFDGRRVLDGVSLDIATGEFFSLLGPSGAGKTTFLRLCAGFEFPDAGEIYIDGQPMKGIPPNERPVNTVFQAYALFPHLTVEENVAFGLTMRRMSRPERARHVGDALALLKMEHLRTRRPAQLSGGEQQRVAIARAIANHPTVCLLDEPMAALDEPLRQVMLDELKTIQRQLGTTFLCVTHHQEEALAVSDRIAVLQDGRIAQIGTPQEVYETPSSRFVAEFIGRSNLVSGTLVAGTDGAVGLSVEEWAMVLPLPSGMPRQSEPGSRLTLVVRAEAVHVADARRETREAPSIRGRLESRRYGGSVWHCTLRLPGACLWEAMIPNDGMAPEELVPGSEVLVHWPVERSTVIVEPAR
ncbi:spermidine/putrescine import ATP-binding protein PotA [Nitrospira sp.]|nr:spermidine/putrescine import ATP-binding protein PotA [Nitrospira sp.]